MARHFAAGGNLETLCKQWVKELGPWIEWQVTGNLNVVVTTDVEAIREAFEVQQLTKSPRYADLLPMLGAKSMLLTEGEAWRAQRDEFNPGFASPFLREAVPQFVECTRHLVNSLNIAADAAAAAAAAASAGGGDAGANGRTSGAAAAAQKAAAGAASGDAAAAAAAAAGAEPGVVLMHHLVVLLTLEIIFKVGFGEEMDLLDPSGPGVAHPLYASFVKLGRHVGSFLDNPALNFMKHLPWNKAKTERLQQEFEDHIMGVLTRRLTAMGIDIPDPHQTTATAHHTAAAAGAAASASACPFAGTAGGATASAAAAAAPPAGCPAHASSPAAAAVAGAAADALAGATATAAGAAGVAGGGRPRTILDLAVERAVADGGSGVDVATLRDAVKTFFAAGHDTTAALVAWTIYNLCTHPEAEAAMVAEIDAVFGGPGGAVEPSWAQLNELKYMTAVLKETLRLRPPVGIIARWSPPGSSLAGYATGGRVLLVSPYLQHTDEAVWGADADEWHPERWAEAGGPVSQPHPYSYMPFSRGPRDCIGAKFALLEAKTILAMVYSRFRLAYARDGPEELLLSITAHPLHGVPVAVQRRAR